MTNNHEPRVRELTMAEIEALRQEMREAIEWARAKLAHRAGCQPLEHRTTDLSK